MSNRLASAQASERVPAPTFELSPTEYSYFVRRANELRGEYIADLMVKSGRWIAKQAREWRRAAEEARAMRELAGLDDRMLADIGVTRSDIPGLVRRAHEDVTPVMEPTRSLEQRLAA